MRIFSRRYSSSRRPLARRWITRILLFNPSTKPNATLVLRIAVRHDAVPVPFDHLGEDFAGFEPLPLQRLAPAFEELPCPGRGAEVPQLSKLLLQQVSRIQSLVRRQELLQRLAAFQTEVLAVRQQGVLLPFDVATI